MLLDELSIQCSLISGNGARLEDAADHWIKMERGEDFDRKVPPIDILAWCTVCLAAMAGIRRLLIGGEKNGVADRRRRELQSLLGNPTLPSFQSPSVRNSWEHLDERLDRLIPQLSSGSISHIHIAARDPSPGVITLKRFDPLTLTVFFLDEGIPLRPAIADAAILQSCLDSAMGRLHNEIVRPWG
jgi:hypothetical protein